MISEWLELDATDDWVRHDAEIVCRQPLSLGCSPSYDDRRLSDKNLRMRLISMSNLPSCLLHEIATMWLRTLVSSMRV